MHPAIAFSQEILVRSGEHVGFTRLVFNLPIGSEWVVSHVGRTVTIEILENGYFFDIIRVFDRIARDKIEEIRQESNRIFLSLNCDCRVSAFLEQKKYLVVDIASSASNLLTLPLPVIGGVFVQKELLAPKRLPTISDLELLARADREKVSDLPKNELSIREKNTLLNTRNKLVTEIDTATKRGLVNLEAYGKSSTKEKKIMKIYKPVLPLNITIENSFNNSSLKENLKIPKNVYVGKKVDNKYIQSIRIKCPASEIFNTNNWASKKSFNTQIGTIRQHLFEEFNQLDSTVALNLAKIYLYFGFGAEARQILLLIVPSIQRDSLLTIAAILENRNVNKASPVFSYIECQPHASLWAILAGETIPKHGSLNSGATIQALNEAPSHLRNVIAPVLSKRFLDFGDPEAAAAALRSIERLSSPIPSAAKLARANLLIDEGNPKAAMVALQDIVSEGSSESPKALANLIDLKFDAGEPIQQKTVELVAAYARENAATSLEAELRRVYALALARSLEFDKSFSLANLLHSDQQDKVMSTLMSQLIAELTKAANDVVFIEHIFARAQQDIESLPDPDQLLLAERLHALGFNEAAQKILLRESSGPLAKAQNLLSASVALSLNQPMRARAALVGMIGADADKLKAQSFMMTRDYVQASRLFERSQLPADSARAAWLAEEVPTDGLSQTMFGPVSQIVKEPLMASDNIDGMLTRGGNALRESSSARQVIMNLLLSSKLSTEPIGELE